MALVLPESVLERERRAVALEMADNILAERRYWEPKLHDIDPHLYLRRARFLASAAGIFPGMWHIIRATGDGPFTAWVISTNGLGVPGEYREMGHDILDELRRGDLWNAERVRERNAEQDRREQSEQRAHENHREARRDDLAVNVKAMTSPGVSLSDTGWTQSKRGRRAKGR